MRGSLTRSAVILLLVVGCIRPTADGRDAPQRRGDWPQWGGPNRNHHATDSSLSRQAAVGAVRERWRAPVGDGFAGLCVSDDTVVSFFSAAGKERVQARSLADGSLRWETSFDVTDADVIDTEFGFGPHATPLSHGGKLYCVGTTGRLNALDARAGTKLWEVQLWRPGPSTRLQRGYASSPVACGDGIILQVGGAGQSLQCYSARDGRLRWQRHDYGNSYCSPLLLDVGGRQHLVALMDQDLVGVDPETGALLWSQPVRASSYVHCVSPVATARGTVVVNTMSGLRAVTVRPGERGGYLVRQAWSSPTKVCQTANMCVVGNDILGATEAGVFVAVDADTGRVRWKSRALGRCSFVHNSGAVLAVEETGHVAIGVLTGEDVEVVWRVQPLVGRAWVGPAVAGDLFLVRDKNVVVAYHLPR